MLKKIKENKHHLVAASVIILLPILAGLILWNQLPDPVPIHFNVHNEADGWSSKPFAVFGLPLLLCVFHCVMVLGAAFDKRNANRDSWMYKMVYWICPAVSLFANTLMYTFALGYTWNINRVMLPLMGVLFIVIGNYLPKVKPNRTLGIKLPWTFESEDNWRATHRFGGKVWVAGGLVFLLTMFLPAEGYMPAMLALFILMVGAPTAYSYMYHRKHGKE